LQTRIGNLNAEIANKMGSVAKRQNDVRKLMELRSNRNGIAVDLDAARNKAQALQGRLQQLKMNPAMKEEAKRTALEVKQADRDVAKLSQQLERNKTTQDKVRQKLNESREAYRKNRTEIGNLNKELEINQRRLEARAKVQEGWGQVKTGLAGGAAVVGTLTPAVSKSADYQAIIRDIAMDANIARTGAEQKMSESIRHDATATGANRNELAGAVGSLVRGGMTADMATEMARAMAKFSVGQGVGTGETARLVLALQQSSINTPEAIEKALGKIAVGGDLGAFKADDMAKSLPDLLKKMREFGIEGEAATHSLIGMLQVQRKVATTSDEASANLGTLLDSLNGAAVKKKFTAQGYDFSASMKEWISSGDDPVTAFIGILQEATKKSDPKRAAQMAETQERIARAQNPEEAGKMLDAYIEQADLAEFITDAQTRNAVLAAMKNKDLYQQNMKLIQSTDGAAKIENDLALKREASKKIWQEVGQAWDETMTLIGDAIAPVTDLAGNAVKGLAQGLGSIVETFPKATASMIGLATAAASFTAVKGVWNMSRGVMGMTRAGQVASGAAGAGGGLLSRIGGSVGGALSRVPILGKLAGKIPGAGVAGKALGAVSAATAQPVFVTNWPAGGLGTVPGGPGGVAEAAGKKGILGRALAGGRGLLNNAAGKIPMIGGALSAGVGASAATLSGAVAAGVAGYGVGTLINERIEKAMSKASGKDTSPGTWLYEKLHPEESNPAAFTPEQQARIDAAKAAKAARDAATATPVNKETAAPSKSEPAIAAPSAPAVPVKDKAVPQQISFSPSLQITVQGDVKDPRKLADELMPHLRRMFDQFQQKAARADLFDPAHA
jgi:hypothetical protein